MSDIELVNPVPVEEARPWLAAVSTTLLGDPYDDDFSRRLARWTSDWIAERTWGARSSGRWVGTLATEPRRITVPGPDGGTGELAVDALTGVTVGVTHRRRGLLTRMITESLTAAKERGDAASILIAAEWPIYGRFGYAPAADDATYTYYSRHSGAAITPSGTGSVRQVDPAELGEHAHRIFAAARARRVGQVDRSELWWRRSLGLGGFERIGKTPNYYLREGPAGPDGVLAWRTTQDFELDGSLGAAEVVELVAANDDAYRDLWALLSGLDVIGKIRLPDRPVDEQVRWLLPDGRALKRTYSGDQTWLRLLDVPAALSARRYSVPGQLVIDVVGDSMGFADGRVLLEADGAAASCTRTEASADLRLSHRALAASYLGGRTLRQLAIGGGVEELRAGALVRADAMFGTGLAPWNATGF